MCLRNLSRRRTRTFLCIFGVSLGVILIVAIGSTTMRYVAAIRQMNSFYSGDVVVVARGAFFIQAFPLGSFLHESKIDEVKRVPGVKSAVPMLFIINTPTHESVLQPVLSNVSVGVPTGNWSVLVGSTPLKPGGRWPSTQSGGREIVIGVRLSQIYGLTVGSTTKIKNHEFRVVGILDTPSSLLRRVILMPLEEAQEVYQYQMSLSMLVVEPEGGTTEEELASRIESEVRGVGALTSQERNEIMEPVLSDLESWSLGIRTAIFSMSMVLVMMVAMINVTEERKALATLDAIGASQSSIVRIVVTETGLIGLFGGLLGIPLGVLIALWITNFYTSIPMPLLLPDIPFYLPMIFEILAYTVVLSCVAGLIPALIANRRNIADVLRSEH